MDNQKLKNLGEDAAAAFVESRGMRLIARNWRTRFGELDLVAMDGDTLVFVEVKARMTDRFMDPSYGVDYRKQVRLRRLAEAFLAVRPPPFVNCRFDVVAVVAGRRPIRVTHIPDAF